MKAPGMGMAPRPGPYDGGAPQVNESGLPIRPGKDQCLLFMNTGSCKNGLNCIFDHPNGVRVGGGAPEKPQVQSKAGMPAPPSSFGAPPPATPMTPMPTGEASAPTGQQDAVPEKFAPEVDERQEPAVVEYNMDGLPIRPGAQKCGYYLRGGKCNYGPTCRFDHPEGMAGLMAGGKGIGAFPGMMGGAALTEGGMARRPGAAQCPFLARTGECPFGPECRFDHNKVAAAAAAPENVVSPARPAGQPERKNSGLGGVRGRRPPPGGKGGLRRPPGF